MVRPTLNGAAAQTERGGGAKPPRRSPVDIVAGQARWVVTHPWVVLAAVGVALFAIWAIGTREVPHKVRAVFSEAPDLYSGEDVQVDGIDVGKVTGITYDDGNAVVGVGIQDSQYWPLHQGTKVTLRFGTTVGNGTRYIQLNPGPDSAPAIPENGIIGENDTVDAVEFDQVFNIFGKKTRSAFQGAMQSGGAIVQNRAPQIGAGIDQTGPALGSVAGFTADLSRNQQALESLVINGARVTSTLASRQGAVQNVISNAAGTFNAFAGNTPGITQSLDQLPPTLTQMKATLSQVDTSLTHLGTFVADIRPGAAQLQTLSADLLPAMTDLRTTIPVANDTFAVGTRAAPAITALLKEAQPFSKVAAPALSALGPMVACVRPYTPEIAGMMSNWVSMTGNYDSVGHLGRLDPSASPDSVVGNPLSVADWVKLTQQGYALIRPPGYDAGQPQYNASCDVTANGLNPADAPNGADTSGESNNG